MRELERVLLREAVAVLAALLVREAVAVPAVGGVEVREGLLLLFEATAAELRAR